MTKSLSFSVDLDLNPAEAEEKVTAALKQEGFGVLTRIDMKETLKKKIDVDFRPYVILGACNPPLAHRALSAEAEVGLLLPCNVVVEETEGGSRVSIVNPYTMLEVGGLGENGKVTDVADEAGAKLKRVADALDA